MAKQKVEWIREQEAAQIMGLSIPYFRRKATGKDRELPIGFTKLNKKTFYYNKVDIDTYMMENSNLFA